MRSMRSHTQRLLLYTADAPDRATTCASARPAHASCGGARVAAPGPAPFPALGLAQTRASETPLASRQTHVPSRYTGHATVLGGWGRRVSSPLRGRPWSESCYVMLCRATRAHLRVSSCLPTDRSGPGGCRSSAGHTTGGGRCTAARVQLDPGRVWRAGARERRRGWWRVCRPLSRGGSPGDDSRIAQNASTPREDRRAPTIGGSVATRRRDLDSHRARAVPALCRQPWP